MNIYQIPRNSLAWLLAAQIAVIAPHITRLPPWVTLVGVACILWRVMVYRGRWRFPKRWTRVAFVLAGLVGVPVGYGTMLGLEPAIALLVVAYVLKLLEMHHKRDAYVVVLLGFFVAMTQFLFFQTIPWTIYIFVCCLTITAGLIGLNQTQTHRRPFLTFRKAGLLTAQSLPLMLVLFVLFPRIPPIWTVPTQNEMAASGVRDVLSPGDIANVAVSSDLAFKVAFEGSPPPYNSLYWRGLTLSNFNGRVWQQEPVTWRLSTLYRYQHSMPIWVDGLVPLGNRFEYSIIMEPTQQPWLFSLTLPELPENREIVMAPDYRLARTEPVRSKFRYNLASSLDYLADLELSEFWRYRNTLLPPEGNPRARQLARQMYSDAGSAGDYITAVLQMFRSGGYVYTLQPGALGENYIDEFLFEARRGFCEHYAGTFAFLMRAAGVPSRVVVGYHGGEYNDVADYLSVYQYDAHAWTEVWLEDEGWVRVDPTTAVAPDRTERGLQAAVEEEATFLANSPFSALTRQSLILAEIRLQLSAISYYWDTWVVGYTPEVQEDLLEEHLGEFDRKTLGFLMLAAFFGILSVIGVVMLLKRAHHRLGPLDRDYLRFCDALARLGLPRRVGEGPNDFAARIGADRPDISEVVHAATDAYVRLNYGAAEEGDAARLKRVTRTLHLRRIG